jgi:predicted DNA-binding protein YlxM (UPF0122 family)
MPKMKKEIISKIEELLKSDGISQIASDIKELRVTYKEAAMAHEESLLKAFVADGGEASDFQSVHDEEDRRFTELMTQFNAKKKAHDQAMATEQQENLATKEQLIIDIKKLIAEETNITNAFKGLREIREKWEKVGMVPKDKIKELQHEFSLQLEYFYYNINIYKTLKEYDLEKNLKLKKELIVKMKALDEVASIHEVKEKVEQYIREWDGVGPTFKENWEAIRDEFWGAAAAVQLKIKNHYIHVKEQHKLNLDAKTLLCERVEAIRVDELTSDKSWRKASNEVLGIQQEWKKIGFATKKQNDKIWLRFRELLDLFFSKKREFYKDLKEEFTAVEKQKMALIEEAEKLKGQTDWKETTEAFIRLQKRWRTSGNAGPQKESRLWKKFNGSCNAFFEAKKHHYDTLDDRLAAHLKQKEEVVNKITAYVLSGDTKKDLKQLQLFSEEWNSIGVVPKDSKEEARSIYNQALDKHYKALKLDGGERDQLKFKNKIAGLKKSENAPDLLVKEQIRVRERIRKVEAEVVQYENNLGFFASAKGDNPLLNQAKQKVEQAKGELEKLRDQLKVIKSQS